MGSRLTMRLGWMLMFGGVLSLAVACASAPSPSTTESESAITAGGAEAEVDLGCPPAPDFCPAEGTPLGMAESDTVPDDGTSAGAYGVHTLADKPLNWGAECVKKLKGITKAAATPIKICLHSVVLCGALVGNANGTAIEKFCAAMAKTVTCKAAAEEENRKIQNKVCESCSGTTACVDGGTK